MPRIIFMMLMPWQKPMALIISRSNIVRRMNALRLDEVRPCFSSSTSHHANSFLIDATADVRVSSFIT